VQAQEEDQLFRRPKGVRIVNIELPSKLLVYRADTAHVSFPRISTR
jgi:hypothetical protein